MIPFKPLALEDKEIIESYTLPYAPPNCDLAFANMFCWQFQFQTAWSIVEGFLVIRFRIGGGNRIGYMQPIGSGDFTEVLRLLEQDVRGEGQRLRLIGLTEEGIACVHRAGIGEFAAESDRDFEDYLYNVSDLRELAGSRYKSKRNHINRFESEYPSYRYEEMTRAHAVECMQLERLWRRGRNDHTEELSAEQRAMQRAFDHFDELGLRGGCIYVGDQLAAFTYGSPINDRTFCIHVEKADTEYEGAFTIINRMFLEHLPPSYTLVDREEDLGLDGLRRSKLSYHPAFLQPKFTALRLHDDELQCKRLFMDVFGDEEALVDRFIIRYYSPSQMLGAYDRERLVAMLHLVPFESELGRTTYIYAVATAAEFRGRGLASSLMARALRLIAERGDDAAILIPAPGLEGFYAPMGFSTELVPVAFDSPDGFDFGSGSPETDRAMVWRPGAAGTASDPCAGSSALPEALHLRWQPRAARKKEVVVG